MGRRPLFYWLNAIGSVGHTPMGLFPVLRSEVLSEVLTLGLVTQDEKLGAIVGPIAESLGYELVRLTFGGSGRPTLQILAERPDGTMEVGDCAILSREVSTVLDVEDVISSEYVLEVSSPGLDRPLTRRKDFDAYKGYEVKLELIMAQDGQRRFRGVLKGIEGDKVLLDAEEGELELEFDGLKKAKLVMTDDLLKKMQDQQDQTAKKAD